MSSRIFFTSSLAFCSDFDELLRHVIGRPVVAWCRDCDKESTDDCLDAGHRQCSQRQRRAERLEPVVELLRRGVAVRAQFDHHFEQVEAGVQRELKNRRATLTRLAEALSSLEAAGEAALPAALPAAEQLAQCVPQLEEGAALLDFEGHCRIELEDEDGSYGWSGCVALESNRWRALRHALLQLQANCKLTQTVSHWPHLGRATCVTQLVICRCR